LIRRKSQNSWKPTQAQIRASEAARAQADREAAKVPWPQLVKAQRDYIYWQANTLWVRCVEETEGECPSWLAEAVENCALGYLSYAADFGLSHRSAPRPNTASRLLELWVNDNIFSKPRTEEWMNAVGYYAVKNLASLRDDAYAESCIKNWKRHKPQPYPTFKVWREASERVSDEMLDQLKMRDDRRELIKRMTRVNPRTLKSSVDRYVEWLAFALWTRAAVEDLAQLPPAVERQLLIRCPGFLERQVAGPQGPPTFAALMQWIESHEFDIAKREGWFDVLVYQAALHPRRARAKDYWIDWEYEWSRQGRPGYPSFSAWARAVDRYTFSLEGSDSRPQDFS
jgi:hypothetical protein